MAKTKISVVKYLNSVPLAWGILEGPNQDDFEPVFSTPAECAQQLASGDVDIGLIPAIEYQRIPGSRIIAGPAIVSPHCALTVFLLSLVPLWDVKTVGFDRASRSSEALSRVIFGEFYGTHPDFHSGDPDPEALLGANDAALLIGDVALKYRAAHELPDAAGQTAYLREGPEPVYMFDLAERWNNLVGLPFVFAFWVARPGFSDRAAAERLRESRDYGLEHLEVIVDRYAESLGLDADFIRRYLKSNLNYHMDSDCIESLGVFYQMARKHGVLDSVRGIEFL